jgi:hypothetical protein
MKLKDKWVIHSGLYQDKKEKYLLTTDLINKYGDLFNNDVLTLIPVNRYHTMITYKNKSIGSIRYNYIGNKKMIDEKTVIMKGSIILGYVYSKKIPSTKSHNKLIKKIIANKHEISLPKYWNRSDGEIFYLYKNYEHNGIKFTDFPDIRSLVLYLTIHLQ